MNVEEEVKRNAMRLEKLENHYEYLKKSNSRIEENISKISDALLGTQFGDIGLVERFKEQTKRTIELEKEIEKIKIYVRQGSFLIGTVIVVLIGIIIKYIFKGL